MKNPLTLSPSTFPQGFLGFRGSYHLKLKGFHIEEASLLDGLLGFALCLDLRFRDSGLIHSVKGRENMFSMSFSLKTGGRDKKMNV